MKKYTVILLYAESSFTYRLLDLSTFTFG